MTTPHPTAPYIGWIGINSNGSMSTGSDVSNRQGGGVTPTFSSIYDFNYDILYVIADYGGLILGSYGQIFGGYTPSIGDVSYRNYYASVYAYGNIGYNVFDVTHTFNPGVYTPDTCDELESIGSNRWKTIHITGRVVAGDGISVMDTSPGVHSSIKSIYIRS